MDGLAKLMHNWCEIRLRPDYLATDKCPARSIFWPGTSGGQARASIMCTRVAPPLLLNSLRVGCMKVGVPIVMGGDNSPFKSQSCSDPRIFFHFPFFPRKNLPSPTSNSPPKLCLVDPTFPITGVARSTERSIISPPFLFLFFF